MFDLSDKLYNPWPAVQARYGLAGSKVAAYVRGTSGVLAPRGAADDLIRGDMVATISQGLARAKAGYGDVVLVMQGHTESLAAAGGLANLSAGVKLIGCCHDAEDDYAPTVSFAATAANWAIDDKNVMIAGLRFDLNGANDITTALDFSAAGGRLYDCFFNSGSGASLDCVNPIKVSSAASNMKIRRCKSRQTSGTTTEVVLIAGTSADTEVSDCDFQMIGSAAATGCIAIAGVATNLRILRNMLYNAHASSTAGISVADAACTGIVADNRSAILANGTAASTGIVFTSTGSLLRCFNNLTCDEPRASGALSPAACAT